MKNIHIPDSYNVWTIPTMVCEIEWLCKKKYGTTNADQVLNRTYKSMYIEWYLHKIGYWLTLPFVYILKIKSYNERFKHVDLEERL